MQTALDIIWALCKCVFGTIVLLMLMCVAAGFVRTLSSIIKGDEHPKRKDDNNDDEDIR